MPWSFRGKLKPARTWSDDPEEFRATLVEHLEELRDRIVRSLLFLGVGWIAGWYLEAPIYSRLNGIITDAIHHRLPPGTDFRIVFHNATEPFFLKLKLSFMIGLVIAFPFIVVQLWSFIAPGLKRN